MLVAARQRRVRGATRTRHHHRGASRITTLLAHAYGTRAVRGGGRPDRRWRRAFNRDGELDTSRGTELERRARRRHAGRDGRAAREEDVELRVAEPRRVVRGVRPRL